MKTRTLIGVALAATVMLLTGCGEKPQSLGGAKSDAAPFAGVGSSPFAQADWKAGDKGSWEQQLKARAQYGQNDYTRMGQ